MDEITFQKPGELMPQAVTSATLQHTNNRPFPQAVVKPSTYMLNTRSVFPRYSAANGMAHIRLIESSVQMKEAAPTTTTPLAADGAAKDGMGTLGVVLITAAVVVGVMLVIGYNR